MISVLDTSDYSILWTVPNNPYDVMGAWVPRSLAANAGDAQWLSGIQHLWENLLNQNNGINPV